MSATQTIAEFATAARTVASPNGEATARTLLDTAAVAVAGLETDVAALLLEQVLSERAPGPATVWGTGLKLAPSQAALVNGTTGHALDWDDAVPGIPMHPGTVLLPALVSVLAGDRDDAAGDDGADVDGARFVHAYDVGAAVFRAVSEVLPVGAHYGRGWHNTSSTGRLAAVAALAHLTGLDAGRTAHALGIAASMVAGSLANFGTMTKPLHAGLAARDAVVAVGLARRGFTSAPGQLEAPRGFFAMYGETTPELLATVSDRLEHWERSWTDDWALKRHPSCYATHRAVDAAMTLHEEAGDAGITGVEVSVPASATSPLLDHLPRTGLEGKFSLDYTVCRALVSGRLELADFTDAAVDDPQVRALMAAYTLEKRSDDGAARQAPHTSVRVTLADGRRLERGVSVTYGDSRNPLTDEDLAKKVRSALAPAGWKPEEADDWSRRLRELPEAEGLRWLQTTLGARP